MPPETRNHPAIPRVKAYVTLVACESVGLLLDVIFLEKHSLGFFHQTLEASAGRAEGRRELPSVLTG